MKKLSAKKRHPLALFVLLLIGLSFTGTAYAAIGTATAPKAAVHTQATSAQIEQGRQLFLEGCSSCHGLNAQGLNADQASGGNGGPNLIGVGAAAVDFQVSTGRMPLAAPEAQAPSKTIQYTPEEIDALAAYVASLGPGPAIPTEADLKYEDADLARGGQLFRTNCAQCHNFAGRGGALSNGAYAPSLMDASPKQIYEAMLTGPQQMPVFSDTSITPDEKRDIIKYIESLKAAPNPGGAALGRLGPVTEGLFIWTAGLGALIAVAVWIGAKVK